MPTLVTGATGLLGSAIVKALLERDETVRILRRKSSKTDLLGPISEQVEHVVGDVTDPVAVEEAMHGVTHVYHAAARVGLEGPKHRDEMNRVNAGGTRVVVDAALHAGVQRLVHTSSIAALGRSDRPEGVIDENTEWVESPANTVYAISKHLAELEVYRGIAEGLDAVMVNPSMIFGVGRSGENTQRLVEHVRDRRLPAIPTGGNGFVDVLDVAQGHLLAMDRGRTGERYILSSQNLTWDEVIKMLADSFGVRPPRFSMNRSLGMVLAVGAEIAGSVFRFSPLINRAAVAQSSSIYRYSNQKAIDELGSTFRPFRRTLERIAGELA